MLVSSDRSTGARGRSRLDQAKPRTGAHSAALGLSGGQLEDVLRTQAPRETPRPHLRPNADHGELPVEEDHVDRKPHESRVERARRGQEDAMPGGEPSPAEETPKAQREAVCDDAALANDAGVRFDPRLSWSHQVPARLFMPREI